MKRILVLCTGNSCRSQMAEGWLRFFAGDTVEVHSAGVESHGLNPRAVAVMKEAGVDIARRTVAKYREAMRIPSSVQRRREKQASHII